jgi:hypothetical protein
VELAFLGFIAWVILTHAATDPIKLSISVLSAGFSFFIGTLYGRAKDRREINRKRAIDLFAEWQSPDMHATRIFVTRYLRSKDAVPSLSQIEENTRVLAKETTDGISKLPELDNPHLVELHFFRLKQFFEKWAVLLTAGDIDERDSRVYMSTYTVWYIDHVMLPWFENEENESWRRWLRTVLRQLGSKKLVVQLDRE